MFGLLVLGVCVFSLFRTNKALFFKRVYLFSFVLLVVSFLFLSFALALRSYISGQLPMSNGYETMMMLGWFSMLLAVIFRHKMIFILPFGFLLSGFCLLVAALGKMNPQITNLVPVLNSPILSLHVSLIMMSYATLAFTFL